MREICVLLILEILKEIHSENPSNLALGHACSEEEKNLKGLIQKGQMVRRMPNETLTKTITKSIKYLNN